MIPPSRERVHAASAAWVFVPAGAPRAEADEYLLVRHPDWTERPVQVVRTHAGRPMAEVVDEVLERARPMVDPAVPSSADVAWWVRLDAPDGLEEALVAHGARPDETVDVLARTIADAADDEPQLHPAGDVELRWSDDLAVFADAVRLAADVFGGVATDRTALKATFPGEAAKVRGGGGGAVVAYLDGRPVGSGGVTLAGPDARLWGGVVLPEARGRGVYRAVLAARLAYAREVGADLAIVKGRVETSGPILRRAGFAAFGQERSWLLPIG
ncbi:GNAT superfamily N-acetyltransferase [Nocardioides aromaticivorans]|uniref:GNAT superfamily N-acetyltransferase n=1 Tax=Nocardioides aromaticivorans TaxID=200618 RepID=A0A7Z0CJ54_9ACTN|nr:GNAT family N-acetyltransferase [Nocardioides aromaticivorans]NYI43321.1 GNAT superfamily N-acetyltransferase [Nocardioides aromaticivorans]